MLLYLLQGLFLLLSEELDLSSKSCLLFIGSKLNSCGLISDSLSLLLSGELGGLGLSL